MTPRISFACAVAAASLAPLAAQSTLVVSSSGSGQYLDIQPAVDAARPGDTIQVRAGTYNNFVVAKGVRILGEDAVHFNFQWTTPMVVIEQLPAGQALTMREISPQIGAPGIHVRDCLGHVHIEDTAPAYGIAIDRSRQVSLHDARPTGLSALTIDNSTVLLTQCTLVSNAAFAYGALECTSSTVTFASGTIKGNTPPLGIGSFGPAVRLYSGQLTVAGDSQTSIEVGFRTFGLSAIEMQGGTLVLDPAVTVVSPGAPPVEVRGGTLVNRATPTLRVDLASRLLTLTVRAPGARSSHIVAGLVQQPSVILPFGELWVSPFHILIDSGPVPPSGVRAAAVQLPRFAPGLTAALQSVVVEPGGLRLSNAVVRTLDG